MMAEGLHMKEGKGSVWYSNSIQSHRNTLLGRYWGQEERYVPRQADIDIDTERHLHMEVTSVLWGTQT